VTSEQNFLLMPAVVAGVDEAKLLVWHVSAGDTFSAGQVLAELENEKAVVEITAESAGVIDALLVPAGGEAIKVGTAIARLRNPIASPAGATD